MRAIFSTLPGVCWALYSSCLCDMLFQLVMVHQNSNWYQTSRKTPSGLSSVRVHVCSSSQHHQADTTALRIIYLKQNRAVIQMDQWGGPPGLSSRPKTFTLTDTNPSYRIQVQSHRNSAQQTDAKAWTLYLMIEWQQNSESTEIIPHLTNSSLWWSRNKFWVLKCLQCFWDSF